MTSEAAPSRLTPNHKWILALLYAGAGRQRFNAPVVGRTRLMKELFLLQARAKVSSAFYAFAGSNYGPSSNDVMRDLGELVRLGLVQVSDEPIPGSHQLTQRGVEQAAAFWRGLPKESTDKIVAIKERFNFMPLAQLLFEVYQAHPDFTKESLIRDRVLAEYDS